MLPENNAIENIGVIPHTPSNFGSMRYNATMNAIKTSDIIILLFMWKRKHTDEKWNLHWNDFNDNRSYDGCSHISGLQL